MLGASERVLVFPCKLLQIDIGDGGASRLMGIMNYPLLVFILSFVLMVFAVLFGRTRARVHPLSGEERGDFDVVLGATLTLLALLIGFSFSMAVSRYDERKKLEESEANAIGTEYVRVDLLPATDATTLHELLRKYLDQRVLFYTTRGPEQIRKINSDTSVLQNQLWSGLHGVAAQPTPVIALALSGMNDVLNSQGYTQAAWLNRIPIAAWALMLVIAMCCNLLIGYGARRTDRRLFVVVPLVVAISFFLIADIDSPRGGTIRVVPENLLSLAESLHTR